MKLPSIKELEAISKIPVNVRRVCIDRVRAVSSKMALNPTFRNRALASTSFLAIRAALMAYAWEKNYHDKLRRKNEKNTRVRVRR